MSTRSIADALDLLASLLAEVDGDDDERAKLAAAREEHGTLRAAATRYALTGAVTTEVDILLRNIAKER